MLQKAGKKLIGTYSNGSNTDKTQVSSRQMEKNPRIDIGKWVKTLALAEELLTTTRRGKVGFP